MKTVFILGAAASCHLQYPLGKGLVEEIINTFQPPEDFGWHDHDVEVFKNALKSSGLSSIDAFLENAEKFFSNDIIKYSDMGRFAITQCLISKEDPDKLVNTDNANWYRYLWNRVHRDIEKLIDGSIAFISFNYDLSLEQFFYQAIQYTRYGHSMSKEKRVELDTFVKKIPLIHVYGRLGYLNWEKEIQSRRSYGEELSASKVWEISKSIKIIRESDGITSQFSEAQKFLEQADQIIFLGFGYDSINLKRLGVGEKIKTPQIKKVLGTVKGLGASERQNVLSAFIENVRPCIKLGGESEEITEFLKNYLQEL